MKLHNYTLGQEIGVREYVKGVGGVVQRKKGKLGNWEQLQKGKIIMKNVKEMGKSSNKLRK